MSSAADIWCALFESELWQKRSRHIMCHWYYDIVIDGKKSEATASKKISTCRLEVKKKDLGSPVPVPVLSVGELWWVQELSACTIHGHAIIRHWGVDRLIKQVCVNNPFLDPSLTQQHSRAPIQWQVLWRRIRYRQQLLRYGCQQSRSARWAIQEVKDFAWRTLSKSIYIWYDYMSHSSQVICW